MMGEYKLVKRQTAFGERFSVYDLDGYVIENFALIDEVRAEFLVTLLNSETAPLLATIQAQQANLQIAADMLEKERAKSERLESTVQSYRDDFKTIIEKISHNEWTLDRVRRFAIEVMTYTKPETPAPKFTVGQEVIWKSHEERGPYTVRKVIHYDNEFGYELDYEDESASYFHYLEDELSAYSEPTPKFARADIVRIMQGGNKGKLGQIKTTTGRGRNYYMVEIMPTGAVEKYHELELELYTAESDTK